MVEDTWLDFSENMGGNGEGIYGFRKKENVRSRLLEEIKELTSVGVQGSFEKDMENGEG